ncbi:UNVERIFIED_CONTAM: hypothetical protein FKN15_075231 [Acipenser sinensis]
MVDVKLKRGAILEALRREQALKHKLSILQQLMSSLLCSSDKLWTGGTKKGIIEMGEQKLRLEEKAKESLKRVLMEKSAAEEKVQSLQRAQLALQQENSQLKDSYEKVKESWAELKSKHTQSVDQLHVLQSKLERAESREVALQARMEGLQQDRDELASRIDVLEEDQHLKREQLGTLTVTSTSVWNINSQPFHTGDRFSMDQAGQGDTKLRHQLLEMESKLGAKETEGGTKKGIIEMGEQKLRLEEKAKESLKRVLMEKSAAEEKVQSLQRAQLALQQENSQLKDSYEKVKESWAELKSEHTQSVDQLHVLQSKLERAESREVALQARMEGLQQDRDELASRIDVLEEDQHLKREQLGTLTVTSTSVWNINSQPFHTGDRFSMDQAGQGDTKLRHQLLEMESKLGAKETECSELRGELGNLEDEYQSCQSKLRQCREELNRFQGRRSQTRRSKWICLSVLLVAVAIAASAFYPDLYEHMNLLFRLVERRLNQYLN